MGTEYLDYLIFSLFEKVNDLEKGFQNKTKNKAK